MDGTDSVGLFRVMDQFRGDMKRQHEATLAASVAAAKEAAEHAVLETMRTMEAEREEQAERLQGFVVEMNHIFSQGREREERAAAALREHYPEKWREVVAALESGQETVWLDEATSRRISELSEKNVE